jgi:predicted nucleic acid-binding protein
MTNPLCFDTRFFMEIFTSTDESSLAKLREIERNCPERHISVITLHEVVHQITTHKGSVLANIVKKHILSKYKIHDVDSDIAIKSAEFRVGHQIPMADTMIAATALRFNFTICTDDPHFNQISNCTTVWIK